MCARRRFEQLQKVHLERCRGSPAVFAPQVVPVCLEAYAPLGGSRNASDLSDASYGPAMPESEANVYAQGPAYAAATTVNLAGMMAAGTVPSDERYATNAIPRVPVEPPKPAKRRRAGPM